MKVREIDGGDYCTMLVLITVVIAIAAIILAMIANNHYVDVMYRDLVKSGQDPIAITCAQDVVSDSPSQACVMYVTGKAK